MSTRICLIQGHPHDDPGHFCWALADAYEEGARSAGFEVERIDLARVEIPYLRNPADFGVTPPAAILDAQNAVTKADHVVVIYPLWLGAMPAFVKSFFEQLSRNEFALAQSEKGGWPRKMLKGKSARVVVTMGMPSVAYRIFFGAHGVKSFESAILGMAGFKPIRDTLIGGVGELSKGDAEKHFVRMRALGARAD